LEYFNSAKKYFNSNPSEYDKSLEELTKINLLKSNISIIHLKILCFLMLSKFEDIIEIYYVNKMILHSNFNLENNKNQIDEIKKIISLAFYNFQTKQKAKIIWPDIKDDYNIENFNFHIVSKRITNDTYNNNSYRIIEDKEKLHKNILNNLEQNRKNSKKEDKINYDNNINDKDKSIDSEKIMPIISDFVDDIISTAKRNIEMSNQKSEIENKIKKSIDKLDNNQSYQKEKENIKKNKSIKEKSKLILLDNGIRISNKKLTESKGGKNSNFIKKKLSSEKNANFLNKEIKKINPQSNKNIPKNLIMKDKRISDSLLDKKSNNNTYKLKNPFEFTLNPDGSFQPISSSYSKNSSEKSPNSSKNKLLLTVEIDDQVINMVLDDNLNKKDSKYINYINIDYNEYENNNRKKMIEQFKESAKNYNYSKKDNLYQSLEIKSNSVRKKKGKDELKVNEKITKTSIKKNNKVEEN
jgi:hypothetical protein